MQLTRRAAFAAGAATLASGRRRARAQSATIRIGLLTDFSGPFRDINGPTSVACLAQAVAEFTAANPDIKVATISADHQNKPDVAVSILRSWFDESGVDMVLNVTNSAIALAATTIITDKNKVCVNTSAGSSVLTGPSCSRNLVHWTYDTWNLSHSSTTQVIKAGGKSWFFVTPNYAYGKALQGDATKFIEAAGGQVLGATIFPFPETTDFSSFIVQAAGSNAQVVAFAIGGTDEVNFIKQAQEFGLTKQARVVGMTGFITDVLSMGLPVAQGLTITENFYWDFNDRTRAFYHRVKPRLGAGSFPNMLHAGDYAGTLHYLKTVQAIGVARAKASGREVVDAMKRLPTDDDCFGPGSIREDGRKLHPAYLWEVKRPDESRGPGDVYKLAGSTPADQAFRPLSDGGCPFVHA
jgi:branched-chain amino acid transport system substrate-binding protein